MKTATLFYELHYLFFYKHDLNQIYRAIKGDWHYYTHFIDELIEDRISYDLCPVWPQVLNYRSHQTPLVPNPAVLPGESGSPEECCLGAFSTEPNPEN